VGALLLLICLSPASADEDLDLGSEVELPVIFDPGNLDADCFPLGGASEAYRGADRLRGNTCTVFERQTLVEFRMWLEVNGTTTLYFYVLESPVQEGAYTVVSETIVPASGGGQAFYSSGPIHAELVPGMFYGVGAAWGAEAVGYLRDPVSLPRDWELGQTVDALQLDAGPPAASVAYNHFPGAEYLLELCFESPTPLGDASWGVLKGTFQ
jgi:hypothetical protein